MKEITEPKTVKTGDGSITFYSQDYDETYHSSSGALAEAFNKFCKPCLISEIAERVGSISILDVGFGLGYNILAALHTASEANPNCIVKIVSLEKDILPNEQLGSLEIPDELKDNFEIVKKAAEDGCYRKGGIDITILEEDARETIQKVDGQFDAVFFDPFSVRKNPEMWTVEFFKEIARRMSDSAILATYSSATPVRTGMIEAGLKIGPGPGDEMKRGGTVATKKGQIDLFSSKELERLKRSPERIPYYDQALNSSREDIIRYREELKEKRP